MLTSNAREASTCPVFKRLNRDMVPHRKNERKGHVYKVGWRNTNALPPQYYNQGPLTRGPFTCQPSHCHVAPPGRPRGLTWPYHTSAPPLHHLSAAWACTALPRGLACHVASVQVPCAMLAPRALWRKTPLFCILKINKKIKINCGKI